MSISILFADSIYSMSYNNNIQHSICISVFAKVRIYSFIYFLFFSIFLLLNINLIYLLTAGRLCICVKPINICQKRCNDIE